MRDVDEVLLTLQRKLPVPRLAVPIVQEWKTYREAKWQSDFSEWMEDSKASRHWYGGGDGMWIARKMYAWFVRARAAIGKIELPPRWMRSQIALRRFGPSRIYGSTSTSQLSTNTRRLRIR